MKIEEMENVTPNKKTFEYDPYRMFIQIGTNAAMYMEYHDHRFQPYVILIDRLSGKRIKITFQEEE